MDPVDDLFPLGSPALARALEELRAVLVAVGFRVHQQKNTEATLRVYLTKAPRPLMNPRFVRGTQKREARASRPCLVVDVWTDAAMRRNFAQCAVSDNESLRYRRIDEARGKDFLAGRFTVAVDLRSDGGLVPESRGALGRTLTEMRSALQVVVDTETLTT